MEYIYTLTNEVSFFFILLHTPFFCSFISCHQNGIKSVQKLKKTRALLHHIDDNPLSSDWKIFMNLLKSFALKKREYFTQKKALKTLTHFHIPWIYILEVLITLTTLGNENFCMHSGCAKFSFIMKNYLMSSEKEKKEATNILHSKAKKKRNKKKMKKLLMISGKTTTCVQISYRCHAIIRCFFATMIKDIFPQITSSHLHTHIHTNLFIFCINIHFSMMLELRI